MKIKTVWHWKNIAKTTAVNFAFAFALMAIGSLADLQDPLIWIIVGVFVGIVATQICFAYWPCWHFENPETEQPK